MKNDEWDAGEVVVGGERIPPHRFANRRNDNIVGGDFANRRDDKTVDGRFARVRNDNAVGEGFASVRNDNLLFDEIAAGEGGGLAIFAVADEEWERRNRLPKRMGEISEAAFLLKASSMGLGVAKPWGESERYDFIVSGRTGAMWRVQVKSTACRYGRGWSASLSCSVAGTGSEYSAEDVDFLVVHVRPVEAWYVLPVKAFVPRRHLNFYPETGSGRWERFRDRWGPLEGKSRKG